MQPDIHLGGIVHVAGIANFLGKSGTSRDEMINFFIMQKPRQFPSPKNVLHRIHQDLANVVIHFDGFNHADLSDIEVLVILLEDRRFFDHYGIDWRSIARETFKMCTFQRHGGASTIDMQFVRTQTGYKERTFRRKLYEMLLAYLLQFRMSKLAILRSYLDVVYLGSGIVGIDRAAFSVYGRPVYRLSRQEAAMIAAMMVYPKPLNPTDEWKQKVHRRAAYGLRLFSTLGRGYKQRFE